MNNLDSYELSEEERARLIDHGSKQAEVLQVILNGLKMIDEDIASKYGGYVFKEIEKLKFFYRCDFGRGMPSSNYKRIIFQFDPDKYFSDWGCNLVRALAQQDDYFFRWMK